MKVLILIYIIYNIYYQLIIVNKSDLKIEDVTEVPSCVYSIPNLKKLLVYVIYIWNKRNL